MKQTGTGHLLWLPVVPEGFATPHLTWRRWIWQVHHSSTVGGHRSPDATQELLRRVCWWPRMAADITQWCARCLACVQHRREPRKNPQVAVRATQYDPWQDVVVDMEGPVNPASADGHRYIMTYMCNFTGAILLEPAKHLKAQEIRRLFSKCMFRSGTLPVVVRTDRGPEFTNTLMREFLALMGVYQHLGTAYRPCEQGRVERMHREVQRAIGLLVRDIVSCAETEWDTVLPAVEFLVYNTPRAHGLTPRDLDRQWSAASPLAKDLQAFTVPEAQLTDEFLRKVFLMYRELRLTVVNAQARASAQSAARANRFRRPQHVSVGDLVAFRDPRGRSAAGRTPWKKTLTGPCTVVKVEGNRITLQGPDGAEYADVHLDNIVLLPDDVAQVPLPPLEIGEDAPAAQRPEVPADADRAQKRFSQLAVGMYIAYHPAGAPAKQCRVGHITQMLWAETTAVVHRHGARFDGRLRLRFVPLFYDAEGSEGPVGVRPAHEQVPAKNILRRVTLFGRGDLHHADTRALESSGKVLQEDTWPDESTALVQPLSAHIAIVRAALLAVEAAPAQPAPAITFAVQQPSTLQPEIQPVEFLEIFAGGAQLTLQVKQHGCSTAHPIDWNYPSYGQNWDLREPLHRGRLAWLIARALRPRVIHLGTPCTAFSQIGKQSPGADDWALVSFTILICRHQQRNRSFASVENPATSNLWRTEIWATAFRPPRGATGALGLFPL